MNPGLQAAMPVREMTEFVRNDGANVGFGQRGEHRITEHQQVPRPEQSGTGNLEGRGVELIGAATECRARRARQAERHHDIHAGDGKIHVGAHVAQDR